VKLAEKNTRRNPEAELGAYITTFINIVGQDGILQRIGNPLGLRSGIGRRLTNLPHSNCENALKIRELSAG
jgi:hypothetical protein